MSIMELTCNELFDFSHSITGENLKNLHYPWEFLSEIEKFILAWSPSEDYVCIGEHMWVHKSAIIANTASINGPCIIGPKTEIRHCAFIRGNAIVGAECVVGNSVELKNCVLFDCVQVPHFNYVGDSILGFKSHMGAGAITSNVKSDKSEVIVKLENENIDTRRKKFGAILGDFVEVGCNSVLNPGTIIGRHTNIYPLSCVRGIIPARCIYKSKDKIVEKK